MNLKQLHQFVVLSETLSFTTAAARLSMSQPPLSVSIRLLEDEIGAYAEEQPDRRIVAASLAADKTLTATSCHQGTRPVNLCCPPAYEITAFVLTD